MKVNIEQCQDAEMIDMVINHSFKSFTDIAEINVYNSGKVTVVKLLNGASGRAVVKKEDGIDPYIGVWIAYAKALRYTLKVIDPCQIIYPRPRKTSKKDN